MRKWQYDPFHLYFELNTDTAPLLVIYHIESNTLTKDFKYESAAVPGF